MTLYLTGAISNNPCYKEDFERARKRLNDAGYAAVSPVIFCKKNWSWNKCVRKCIEVIARNENLAIALIESEYESKGRDLELEIAKALDLEIKTVDAWVEAAHRQNQRYQNKQLNTRGK